MRIRMLSCLGAVLALCLPAGAAESQLPATLVDPAIAIHVALAADTTEGVASHAAALSQAAAALGPAAAPVVIAARALAAQTDLAGMRNAFGDMSKALITCLRAGQLSLPVNVRRAYCPMARRQWLQQDGAVQNPYYGRAMSTCGDFTD